MQNGITHKPNTAQATSYYTGFGYNDLGQLTRANIADGRQRTVTFRLNADGQILRRDEADNVASTGDPHEVWYRFNGRQLGSTGNNGTNDLRNAASIAEREQVGPTTPGAFRGGQTQSITHADFADSSDAINSYSQGSSAGGYTVRSGDTLAGIAQAIWGDASLWYKLAQANGLSGSGGGASPAAGTVLMLPAGVVRSTYNASTLTPYNPAEAIGDLTPSTPTPQAPKKNKCGVFGQILLAVVAIAVSFALPQLSPFFGKGIGVVLGGAISSTVSQGVGLATGIQDKFSFKGVALAAIGAGVGLGIGKIGGGIGKFLGADKFLSNVARGALANAATQGVAIATGLQTKFDFVGVAVGGAVGGAVGIANRTLAHNKIGVKAGLITPDTPRNAGFYLNQALSGTAGALAGAATRSAIDGSSFGDNIVAALPDVIASTIGNIAGDRLNRREVTTVADGRPRYLVAPDPEDTDPITVYAPSWYKSGVAWFNNTVSGAWTAFTNSTLVQRITMSITRASENVRPFISQAYQVASQNIRGAWNYVMPRAAAIDARYHVTTRALGLAQAGFGAVGTLAAGAATIASLPAAATGVGAVAPIGFGALTAIEADQTIAGVRTVITGRQTNSLGAQGVNAVTGISANTADIGLGLTGGVTSLVSGGRAILARSTAAERIGADLVASRPSILSDASLSAQDLAYVTKQFARKEASILRAADRGELTYSPGTGAGRIESLQAAYRDAVAARYERRYGRPLDLSRLNADHPIDLVIGGSPTQPLRMLNQSVNKSVGSSLMQAARREGLQPGDPIRSIKFK